MIYVILILNVILLGFAFNGTDNKKWDVILAEAISVFFGVFTISSGVLWIIDIYSLENNILVSTIISLIIVVVNFIIKKKKQINIFEVKNNAFSNKWLISRLVILLACLISTGSFATFGIGRNDGNALIQAYSQYKGNYSTEYAVAEMNGIIEGSEYSKYFEDTIVNLDTTDFTGEYWYVDKEIEKDGGQITYKEMLGSYGNNPVYASVLELGMALFGMTHANYINVIVLFCMLIFMDSILMRLRCKWGLRTLLIALMGIVPLVVYANHTAIVESLMMFCIVTVFYYLNDSTSHRQMFTALYVTTLMMLNVSAFVLIPIILIMFWLSFIRRGKKSILVVSALSAVGYGLSYLLLMETARNNTFTVYRQALFFLNDNQVTIVVVACILASLVVTLVLALIMKNKISEAINSFLSKKGKRVFKLSLLGCMVISIAATVFFGIMECGSFKDVTMLSLPAIMMLTGVVIIPAIVIGIILMKYSIGLEEALYLVFFVYGVLIYSVMARPVIDSYYFEARYLLLFIPIVIIVAAIMLKTMKEDAWYIPVVAIILLVIPYTTAVMNVKAETRVEWDNVLNVVEEIEAKADGEVVLLDEGLMKEFYHLIELSTDLSVYPYQEGIRGLIARDSDILGKKVLLITSENVASYAETGNVVYSNRNKKSGASKFSPVIGLPSQYDITEEDYIQIIEFDDYSELLSEEDCINGNLTYNRIFWKINDIIIEDDVAEVKVSLTYRPDVLYYNAEEMSISYHLEYEDEILNAYDHKRTEIGNGQFINGFDKTLEIPLEKIEDDEVIAIIDIVRDGKDWYSWRHKDCPVIRFSNSEEGWQYEIVEDYYE